jgi:WD40 repeat protein
MAVERYDGAAATLLGDGRVLVTGGAGAGEAALSVAEIYDPSTGAWTQTGSMLSGHYDHTSILLKDGRVLIVAGCDDHTTAELYNPASGKFSAAGKVAIDGTCESTATLLPDGRVLIAGGYGDNYSVSKLAELFDPATGKFTRTGSLYTARGDAQAVLLPDGRVLVMGGDQAAGTQSEVDLNSSEIYDPATGKFSKAATMATPRTDFSATMLTDGKVLVAGGWYASVEGAGALDSAELYNPATGKFSPTGSMTIARSADWGASYESGLEYMHTSLLHDGRVLFIGGDEPQEGSSVYQPTAEIYDPATGVFSATAALPVSDIGNDNNSSVTLKDGRVLIPGIPSLLYTP